MIIHPEHLSSRYFLLGAVFLLALVGLTACGSETTFAMAPLSEMPDFVQSAPVRVQQAYQFAVANPDMLTHQPCYCGCGAMGHTSNLSCYIQDVDTNGVVRFDNHAAGCGICVDITQDVMRMTREGQSQPAIRQYVDATYSSFGPSTDTPLPEV
ncbi:MAG: PCYCGC domain-containing protein [Anaerolineae bacterium]|nr:PCYCGC domain-containing protein [Anaerolineae bacterium]